MQHEDIQTVRLILNEIIDTSVCAFGADGLSVSDLKETADFKSSVQEYMKKKRIAAAS